MEAPLNASEIAHLAPARLKLLSAVDLHRNRPMSREKVAVAVDSHQSAPSLPRQRALRCFYVTERRVLSTGWLWASVCAGVLCATLLTAAALAEMRRRARGAFKRLHIKDMESMMHKEVSAEDLTSVGSVDDVWEMHPELLLLQEVLGEGAFGIVRRAKLAPSNKMVAVKMLKEYPTLEERRQMHSEMDLMKNVGTHPNVVSLVGCCSGRRPMLVVEYCNRGDLLSYLRSAWDAILFRRNALCTNNNDLDQEKLKSADIGDAAINKLYQIRGHCDVDLTAVDLLSFCRQIARGMEFLSNNRVVHRDLAARNVLVCSDKIVKIADFGLSRDVYLESHYKQKSNGKLPVKWMAIESLMHQIYTSQSDVWSFGVVIWELVTLGGTPYPGVPPARLPRFLRSGYRMPRPTNCSDQLYDVMTSCWKSRPHERPTFAELHRQLDAMLDAESANQYLVLELDEDRTPAISRTQNYRKYIQSMLYKWMKRGESYEQPLRTVQSNHYTSPPEPRAKIAT